MKRFICLAMLILFGMASGQARAQSTPEIPTEVAQWINRYHMQPLPVEGGWWAQILKSSEIIRGIALPPRYDGVDHPMSTAIIFAETHTAFSAMHSLKTDEVWHYYAGDPIRLLLLYPDGKGKEIHINAQNPVFVVPHGVWQGSSTDGGQGWSVCGTTMAPGYMDSDFTLGSRASLVKEYPAFQKSIISLTRPQQSK